MADQGVATKTPENDGNEKANDNSIVSGDTPAQQGASMGVSIARQTYKLSVVELMSRYRSIV